MENYTPSKFQRQFITQVLSTPFADQEVLNAYVKDTRLLHYELMSHWNNYPGDIVTHTFNGASVSVVTHIADVHPSTIAIKRVWKVQSMRYAQLLLSQPL